MGGVGGKAEIYISSGLCATLGNAWVTFSVLLLRSEMQREQICVLKISEQIG